MRIEKIIVYGDALEPRVLPFGSGLNIITGASKTGKSALIEIVEYCLGGGDFTIPFGVIRDKARWYAVILNDEQGRIFVARPRPGADKKTTTSICVILDPTPDFPRSTNDLSVNSNIDILNTLLTARIGIRDNLFEPPRTNSRPPLEATIRHALKFCMQAQNEIANRDLLFHKQVDSWIAQALRDALPYLIGFVPDDQITLTKELRALRMQEKRLQADLQAEDRFKDRGGSTAQLLLAEALEAGLLPAGAVSSQSDPVETLNAVAKRQIKEQETFADLDDGLKELRERRMELNRQYRDAKEVLSEYRRFEQERGAYGGILGEQAARLSAVLLVDEDADVAPICPICEQRLPKDMPSVAQLRAQYQQLSSSSTTISASQPKVAALIEKIQFEVDHIREELRNNQLAVTELADRSDSLVLNNSIALRQAEVRGRISLFLDSRTGEAIFPSLAKQRLVEIQNRIASIDEQLVAFADESLEESASNTIAAEMTRRSSQLDFEYEHLPMRIDFRRLLVVVDTDKGPVSMPHMGGGANWMACHVLAHLSLHALSSRNRPVPRFLILDQPTQVYYPPESDDASRDSRLNEDRVAVDKLYRLLQLVAHEAGIQIIVTDHADLDEPYFQDAVVEKWRGGSALIPADWPNAN